MTSESSICEPAVLPCVMMVDRTAGNSKMGGVYLTICEIIPSNILSPENNEN